MSVIEQKKGRWPAAVGDAAPKRGNRFVKVILLALLTLFGWRIEAAVPDLPKFVLVGSPHTSNWDFILAMAAVFAIGLRMSWMGKESMFRGLHGRLFTWLGGVPIKRDKKCGVVEQTIQTFNSRDRFVIGIMPEGTRQKVHQWKSGFYHIAYGAKVPLVMVRFDYGRKVVGIGPTFIPTGNLAGDLVEIKALFEGVRGRNPSQSSA